MWPGKVAGPCSSVDGSWLHHPGRVSCAASANPPRGAPCSGEAATAPPEGAWPQGRDSQLRQEEPGGGERPHCGIWLGQSFSGSFCHVTQGRGRARLSPIAVAAAVLWHVRRSLRSTGAGEGPGEPYSLEPRNGCDAPPVAAPQVTGDNCLYGHRGPERVMTALRAHGMLPPPESPVHRRSPMRSFWGPPRTQNDRDRGQYRQEQLRRLRAGRPGPGDRDPACC